MPTDRCAQAYLQKPITPWLLLHDQDMRPLLDVAGDVLGMGRKLRSRLQVFQGHFPLGEVRSQRRGFLAVD